MLVSILFTSGSWFQQQIIVEGLTDIVHIFCDSSQEEKNNVEDVQ